MYVWIPVDEDDDHLDQLAFKLLSLKPMFEVFKFGFMIFKPRFEVQTLVLRIMCIRLAETPV